jgi:hypothetical protein
MDWKAQLQAQLDESLAVVRATQEQFHGPRYWEQ